MNLLRGLALLLLWLPLGAGELLSPSGWRRNPGDLQPSAHSGDGLTLSLHFRDVNRQLTATLPGRRDFSDTTSFRFRLEVESPRPLLEATLEFPSGRGGYRTSFTLHEAGPVHVLLPKADFTPYGQPAGWDKVEAVRLAFWPRETGKTRLRHVRLDAREDAVWIVDPEPVAAGGDEIYTSRVSVRHMGRLLGELGLPHGRIPIDRLENPGKAKVLIFPYLPRLPEDLFDRLRRASTRGTKLIVFEAAHPGLADLLGVKLGPEIRSNTVGKYNRLRFRSTGWVTPRENVYQHAWTFRSLTPADGAFSLAGWENAEGGPTGETAAVLTPRGAWFNSAWRSGDLSAKTDTLRALIGYVSPWTLFESARFHRETRSPAAFQKRHADFQPGAGASSVMWDRSGQLYAMGLDFLSKRKSREAVRAFRASLRLQRKAYAAAQSAWTPDVRGIWDQQGTGFRVGGWDETCRILNENGFNTVFAHMATAGRAHYPSNIIPPSKTLEKYGNQLTAFSTAARRHGLRAHAWKICWKLNTRDPAFQQRLEREGRLMQTADGKTIPWLSLSDPRNVQHEIDAVLEMLRAAPLDGIHLDYMRYPGREADYGPAARKAFEKQIGRRLPDWPREALGPLKDAFHGFRRDEVHRAVRDISRAVREHFPSVTLSVAVWGAWPDCADAQGQDWPVWGRNDWVDWLIPMNYTDNLHQFEGWLDLQRRQPGVAGKLIPGLGLISSNAELSPAQLLDQLGRVRDRGLNGFVLYRLDASLRERVFPYLRGGLLRN